MTNIFTNFSSPVTSGSPVVPVNNSKTTVQDDKAIKKAKRMEVVKTVAPIAVCAITIPITAAVTYKIANKNTKALKQQISNLGDDLAKLKEVIPETAKIADTVKKQADKSRKDNAQIWSAILAIGGLTGTYKAGKLSAADKKEVTAKVGDRVSNVEARSNEAVYKSEQALSTSQNSLSRKYLKNLNGIQLLQNNDAMNRNSVKYEAAIKQIQTAAPNYLYNAPKAKPITSENPTLWSVTSEFAPIKEGGLGSVPVEIQNNVSKLGIDIPTFIPMYQREGSAVLKQENGKYTYTYKGKKFELEKAASFKVDSFQGSKPQTEDVEVFVSNAGGKKLVFIKNDTYFDGTIYQTTNKTEEPEKFAFFSKAVYEFAKAKVDENSVKGLKIENRETFDSVKAPDAFVLNDWQASPIAALARYKAPMENAHGQLSDEASKKLSEMNIITIGHNAMYQGSTQNNNDNAQRTQATSNILNTLFDSYTYDIVSNARTNASQTNIADSGLANLDNVLILNSQNSYENHTNLLNMGICLSDYFHPVSQNYAKEIISDSHPELAGELRWALTQKTNAGSVVGIINGNDFNNLSIEAKKDTIKNQTGLDFETYNKQSDINSIMEARTQNKVKFYNEFMVPFTENKGRNGLVSEGETKLEKLDYANLAQTPVIASVGRLVSQKGIGIMSDAIKMLMDNWEQDFPGKNKPIFYIAGSDGEGGVHAARLKKLKSDDLSKEDSNRVVFANGFAPMTAITAASDFFLLPSIFEPCGLTQGEAFAVATPVIGSAVGGIVDTVNRDGKTNGILTDKNKPLDADGFYQAMKKGLQVYFNNPEQYKKMVSDSLAEDFSWIQKGKQGPVYDYLDKIGIDRKTLPDVQ
ncbi:MAG: glycogen synthase [Cyanobacteria bacterium SIG29]|nr:glycogen synthase [Cyanobacteria bacterium SIG29]